MMRVRRGIRRCGRVGVEESLLSDFSGLLSITPPLPPPAILPSTGPPFDSTVSLSSNCTLLFGAVHYCLDVYSI